MTGKHQVEEGISNWLLLAIVLACASPAITLNVWPRIEVILTGGLSSNAVGIVLLVTLSALGMTCVPFAMKKSENLGFWLTCLIFGIGLGLLNYTMAVGAVGKSRDEEAGGKALLIQKAAALRTAIAEREKSRRDLPAFKWTTQEMVQTAIRAVDLAREARDQECGKVGDICRARVAQLANRQSELADLTASRAATDYAERIDRSIQDSRLSLTNLGAIPESADQQASRLAAFLGTFLSLGAKPAETVASGLIHFLALCAEAFALGMPRIVVTALSRKEPKVKITDAQTLTEIRPPVQTPAVPKRLPSIPKSPARNEASVEDWKGAALIRSTGKIRDWEVFENYKHWAKTQNQSPASFLDFDRRIQGLGIAKQTDPTLKRDFYLEVAIKTTLKAVS